MKRKKALAQANLGHCHDALEGHDHIHAANCGHKSYVHNGHVCYEHDGHYHYMHDGHTHACAGPFAGVAKHTATTTTNVNKRPGSVHNLADARSKKNQK